MASPLRRMEDYLGSVLGGVNAYPEHVQKVAVFRQFIAERPTDELKRQLPPELAMMFSGATNPSVWVSEVKANAVLLGMRDACYGSDEEFVNAALQANQRLFASPMYRLLMKVASPALMLKNSQRYWNVFHRGMNLVLSRYDESGKSCVFTLVFPVSLLPELVARAYATAFASAIAAAGGKNVRSEIVGHDGFRSEFLVRWA